jgi:dephospho-CoA kinase
LGLLKSKPGQVVAALTGGIATGKSSVAELLSAFGARRLDFDVFSRQAIAPNTAGFNAVLELFGPKAIEDNDLNRQYIGRLIFKDQRLRRLLEDIVHPIAWSIMLDELQKLPQSRLTIIETPLLYEAALNSLFSPVILSFAKPETQFKRLKARNPELSRWEVRRRIKAQMPIMEKLRRADLIVDNDNDLPRLIYNTKRLWDFLTTSWGVTHERDQLL